MQILAPEESFLGVPDKGMTFENSQTVVIPFGLEHSTSYEPGCSRGPQAIITASHQVELFDETLGYEPYKDSRIVTLPEPTISKSTKVALEQLSSIVSEVIEYNKFPVILGGEHTITAAAMNAFQKKYNDIVILHFDAHADLRDSYLDNPLSHACAMRRCVDLPGINLVSFGIRNISSEEALYAREHSDKTKLFYAFQKKNWDMQHILTLFEQKNVYITFDVDAFDSSLMPATGTPEPGGLFWDEVIDIISSVSKVSRIIGADINELSPRDGLHGCDFLAAKLTYKIISHSIISHTRLDKKPNIQYKKITKANTQEH